MSPNQTPSTPDEISRGPRVKNNNRKLLRTNSHCSLNGASGTGKKNRQTNKPTDAKPFRTDVFALGLDGRAGGPAQLPLRRRPPFPTQSAAFNATEVSRARRFAGSWFLGLHFRVFFFHSPAAHPKDLSRSGLANDDGSRAIIGTRTTSVSSPWPTSTERTFTLSSHLRHFLRPALGRKQDPIGHLATLSGVGTARISTPYWLVNKDQLKKS